MSRIRRLGGEAEDRAADYLLSRGYTLLGRRLKMPSGELDLVALDGAELVIVEVKQSEHGNPEVRLTTEKTKRIEAAAEEFMLKNGMEHHRMRYDLIAVVGDEIRHYPDAWRP